MISAPDIPPITSAALPAALTEPTSAKTEAGLKRVLRPLHLWGIAVGLVISGDYFGWNYGLGKAGPVGMLVAVLLVTAMYVCFIFSYTELSTAIPHSGGPYAYARRALGPFFGLLAGVATLLEFVFAPPAIALAIGSYVHFRVPTLPVKLVAVCAYVLFALLNCWGVELAARFELFVTGLAVFELAVFFGITGPHVEAARLFAQPLLPFGVSGIFLALPFAIWFYLALEGVAMSAEEAVNPRRDIPIGYTAGLLTLVTLALGTLICTSGVVPWPELLKDDSPLPRAMARVLSPGHFLTHMMIYIGLFGLLASFHGIMMGYSRQVFALARGGYLPPFLAYLHPRRGTPIWAIIAPAVLGLFVVWTGQTDQAITLSGLGATLLYILSMVSLFVLRRRDKELSRPYRAPGYPVLPMVALVLALVCLGAIVYSAPALALTCLGIYLGFGLYYLLHARRRVLRIVDASLTIKAAVLLLLSFSACTERAVPDPMPSAQRYLDLVASNRVDAAYAMLTADFRSHCDRPCFGRLLDSQRLELLAARTQVHSGEARVTMYAEQALADGTVLKLVHENEPGRTRYLFATNPLDFYPQDTPERTLLSFMRAAAAQRYEALLRFVPKSLEGQYTLEVLKERFSLPHREKVLEQLAAIRRHLGEPFIYDKDGRTARLPIGDGKEAQLIFEGERWRVVKLE